MVNLTINNKKIEVEPGITILDACKKLNIEIPTFCYDDRLKIHGSCRVCVVEVEKSKKLMAACATQVKENMVVHTHSDRVMRARKEILELMWGVHDNDCLSCQKAGGCKLQDYCFEYGVDADTSEYKLKLEGRYDATNEFYTIDRDKCIQCGKCIRMCRELQGTSAIGFTKRSGEMHVAHPFGSGMEHSSCVSCGNCVNVCPTGALMEKKKKPFRVWDTDRTVRTTCIYCGVGCQIDLEIKDNKIVRIDPAVDALNKGLLCVKGKFVYNFVDHPDRLTTPLIKKEGKFVESSWEEALGLVVSKMKSTKSKYGSDAFAALSSAKCTTEDNYVIQKLFRAVLGTNNIDHCARL